MTVEEIEARLVDPQPVRAGVFCEMSGYAPMTLRKAMRAGAIRGVVLPGTREHRIPVAEARRVLIDLGILLDRPGRPQLLHGTRFKA